MRLLRIVSTYKPLLTRGKCCYDDRESSISLSIYNYMQSNAFSKPLSLVICSISNGDVVYCPYQLRSPFPRSKPPLNWLSGFTTLPCRTVNFTSPSQSCGFTLAIQMHCAAPSCRVSLGAGGAGTGRTSPSAFALSTLSNPKASGLR